MLHLLTSSIMTLSFILFSTISFAAPATLKVHGSLRVVELDSKLKNALKKYDPSFRVLKETDFSSEAISLFANDEPQAPMFAQADFDGDKNTDIALMGKSGDSYVAIIALKDSSQEWKFFEVVRYSKNEVSLVKNKKLNIYLSIFASKNLKYKDKGGLSQRDALQIEKYQGETNSYYFDGTQVAPYSGVPL